MNYKIVWHVYYYEKENIFTDDCGQIIYDMLRIITPNELFLFKQDRSFNCFGMKGNKDVIVEILSVPDEVCGWEAIIDIDLGDDLERIARYEKWRN